MARMFDRFPGVGKLGIAVVVLVLLYLCLTVIPAGHVGVKDFFGRVSDQVLPPGINVVPPGTRVILFSVQTREMRSSVTRAACPSS